MAILVALLAALPLAAQRRSKGHPKPSQKKAAPLPEQKPTGPMVAATFQGLALRSIGPALTSGRVIAFAVDPNNRFHYYVASASGGVWKTENDGGTWTPVFDHEGSYSIGEIAMDPKNPAVVWVGTGEANSQRSVSYGDGVYRTDDGGKTWTNVGLKTSEHIGRIVIDPKNTNTVYVAAEGPLWGPGGDRGLYKTTDAGKTWTKALSISEHTGVADVVMDPENPDVLYATSWQRERKQWTVIDGGPESAIYKTADAGKTWTKLTKGLPKVDLGRIGLAISPANPNVIYAEVDAADGKGGIFRSTDRGASWKRQNPYHAQGMYYGQIIADPKDPDRVYVMNVLISVSDDGGKTLRLLGEKWKHVDNHALWIDPRDPSYLLDGCDGGVYESYDRGRNWIFKANLPVTQFYDVDVDTHAPFYSVYGGTQDNFSLGGPSRTQNASGITNADWFVTTGGDGFHSRVDPEDPDTIYAESQYGGLVRFDRRTGQQTGIQPQPPEGAPPLRWFWDSPLLVSSQQHTRIYFGANILFQSDDRGDNWKTVSPDLSRQIDRNKLPVMGKVWGPDAVGKNESTSFYGTLVTISESPLKEGMLYVGTDDGLIQMTPDDGATWTRYDKFPGVPERTFVSRVMASSHDLNTVYAAFDNHKSSDFHPYLLKSTDAGKTWSSIAGNLPENGPVLSLAEDPVDPNLLFAGTEFGLFFTVDDGKAWVQLKGGMPTISVHDLAIQKQMNDLVAATFGRGFYVLDDFTPLRGLTAQSLKQDSILFPARDALMYIQATPLGMRGKSFQGAAYFTAPNPPFGATFTYYLREKLKTKKEKREEAEKKAAKKGIILPYPTAAEFRAEAEEPAPTIFFTVYDSSDQAVRRIPAANAAGIHRASWDLRYPATAVPPKPPSEMEREFSPGRYRGPLVMAGTYHVTLSKEEEGNVTQLAGPVSFQVVVQGAERMRPEDRASLVEFQTKVARLYRALYGALQTANRLNSRINDIERALGETPGAYPQLITRAEAIRQKDNDILRALRGDVVMQQRNENVPESIDGRVTTIMEDERMSTAPPTGTDRQNFAIASREFTQALLQLRNLVQVDLAGLQKQMQAAGAPWTPGTIPNWPEQ